MLTQLMSIGQAQKLTGAEILVFYNQTNLQSFATSGLTKTPTNLSLTVDGVVHNYDLTQEGTGQIPLCQINA
jgi:hypothetical protein